MEQDIAKAQSGLEEAARRLAGTPSSEDVGHAFDALLVAWRSLRAAEIAELCELLSARTCVTLTSLATAGSQNDRMVAWASAFRDHSPLGLAPLLVDFEASIRGNAQPRFVFPRADALSTVRDDPRIPPAILRALTVINGGSKWQKVLLRYFRALDASGDPRTIDDLAAILDKNGEGLANDLVGGLRDFALERGPETLRALRDRFGRVPGLPLELDPIVQSIKGRIASLDPALAIDTRRVVKSAALGDPASLLRDVYNAPDDDDARLVLADALMENGDPRGELITLQMRRAAGEVTPKTLAREKQLLKANMRAWLGPLVSVVPLKSAVFDRGFLARCEATTTSRAMAELHFHHPEWATVRAIEFRGTSLITPAMKGLREAGAIDDFAIRKLGAMGGHPSLERLVVSSSGDTHAQNALSACALPGLRHLVMRMWSSALRPTDFSWLWSTSWGEQLLTLGMPLTQYLFEWVDVIMQRPHVREIRFHPYGEMTTVMEPMDDGVAVTMNHSRTNWTEAPPFLVRAICDSINRLNGSALVRALRVHTNGEIFADGPRAEIERAVEKLPGRRQTVLPWS